MTIEELSERLEATAAENKLLAWSAKVAAVMALTFAVGPETWPAFLEYARACGCDIGDTETDKARTMFARSALRFLDTLQPGEEMLRGLPPAERAELRGRIARFQAAFTVPGAHE